MPDLPFKIGATVTSSPVVQEVDLKVSDPHNFEELIPTSGLSGSIPSAGDL